MGDGGGILFSSAGACSDDFLKYAPAVLTSAACLEMVSRRKREANGGLYYKLLYRASAVILLRGSPGLVLAEPA